LLGTKVEFRPVIERPDAFRGSLPLIQAYVVPSHSLTDHPSISFD